MILIHSFRTQKDKDKMTEKDKLHFLVSSATITDYLILEAYMGNKLIADILNENGRWEVDFIFEDGQRSIPWEIFTQIHQKFADFVEEMKNYPVIPSEKE